VIENNKVKIQNIRVVNQKEPKLAKEFIKSIITQPVKQVFETKPRMNAHKSPSPPGEAQEGKQ